MPLRALLIVVTAVALVLTACGDDNNEEQGQVDANGAARIPEARTGTIVPPTATLAPLASTPASGSSPRLFLEPSIGPCSGKVDVRGSGFTPTTGRPHEQLTLQLVALRGRWSSAAIQTGSFEFLRLGVQSDGTFVATIELVLPAVTDALCGADTITVVAADTANASEAASAVYDVR